ncbi:MAG: MerR family transcriptional regulator [Thermoanaerobaculia bacterium]|nr:MerR family transcriptional regulator [Thermoanaerobaculia bacterium]
MTQTTSENAEVRYKIGDVCRIADVQPYVLRYWESEFPLLAPDRSLPGPRTYSARELELIGQIKRLLYDEGYTIAGAKKRLESEAAGGRSHDTNPAFIPIDAGKGEKGDKSPEKSGEKTVKPPPSRRPSSKSATPVFVETSPATGRTEPVGTASAAVPASDGTAQTPDPRIAGVVAELKEILKLLGGE